MAIYHLEAKVISRGTGRSAVAAAAYMSCSQITNEYDGVQHDYTRKQGLVWQQIFLPEYAPPEWADRAVLWNAVEENEKTKDSRLAREFVVALPVEMGRAEWQQLLTDFIQENLVADGMCADVAIHDTDGHNPHAHIMVTVRPLDEHGKWQYKTEKEYLCIRDGEERGFTGAEFKQAQKEGWEKQYQYKVGRKKEYMTPSTAEAAGYERASKTPKSTEVFSVSATRFMSGKFPFMIFGLVGAALAMYHTARPEKKKVVGGLLLSAAMTSMLTGITEPLEFTFLFVAPAMYVVHCIYAGLSYMLMHIFNVGVGMTFSGGLIDLTLFGILQGNAKTNWIWIVIIGIVYFFFD